MAALAVTEKIFAAHPSYEQSRTRCVWACDFVDVEESIVCVKGVVQVNSSGRKWDEWEEGFYWSLECA